MYSIASLRISSKIDSSRTGTNKIPTNKVIVTQVKNHLRDHQGKWLLIAEL
jgi:hypothetical protein